MQSINFDLGFSLRSRVFSLLTSQCVLRKLFLFKLFYFTFFDGDVMMILLLLLVEHKFFFARTHLVYTQIHDQLMNKQRLRLRGRFDDDDDNDGIKWQQRRPRLMRETFFSLCSLCIYFLFHTAITLWASVQNEHTKIECTHTLTHPYTGT